MKRILIFGNSGSGKSTLAKQLGIKLQLPVWHLDILSLDKHWQRYHDDMVIPKLSRVIEGDSWIIDGHYTRLLYVERLERSDTIIFLDTPALICFWRCIKRVWRSRVLKTSRAGAKNEQKDTMTPKFAYWILWKYPKKIRPGILSMLEKYPCKVIHVQNRNDLISFIKKYL